MKGYRVNAVLNGQTKKWMETRDYATAIGYAGSWGKRIDFVENEKIVQRQPDKVQLIDLDADTTREQDGGTKW